MSAMCSLEALTALEGPMEGVAEASVVVDFRAGKKAAVEGHFA